MIDLFGRKAKAELQALNQRITFLDEELGRYSRLCDHLNQTILEQADMIREMDQLVFRMSQCTDWPSMRPIFNELLALTSDRQKRESDRIGDIVRKEVVDIYMGQGQTHRVQLMGPKR